ncbi:hypothetical protein IVA73_06275 [Bradyrhizobium sp. 131]|nr:hypothetical protein IVA73_06275 [Bradyrhizobium sp. 131]
MIRDLMIGAASAEGFVVARSQATHPSGVYAGAVAASAGQFLGGLFGNKQRKTGWMRAEVADDTGPRRQQAILGRALWDADALRDIVRELRAGNARR